MYIDQKLCNRFQVNINEGVRSKRAFLCLGLQVLIKRAYEILKYYSFLWLLIYCRYYLNINLESSVVLITKLSSNKL